MRQHQAHLQQDLDLIDDGRGVAEVEALGAIAALEQKSLTACRLRQLRLEGANFPGRNQRRQARDLFNDTLDRRRDRDKPAVAGPASWSTNREPTFETRGTASSMATYLHSHFSVRNMAIASISISRSGRHRCAWMPTEAGNGSRPCSLKNSVRPSLNTA